MSNEEANKVLEELYEVGPEKLNDKAKRLFEAMMKIADERDSVKADLYEANNRINDLLDIVKQKDKIIQEMIEVIIDSGICDYFIKQHCVHYAGKNKKTCDNCLKEYFEERCK